MSEQLRLQREQLHRFIGEDPDAIRVFEKLFRGYNDLVGPTAKAIDADYTYTGRGDTRGVDVTTGAATITVTLPPSEGLFFGDTFIVSKADAGVGSITIATSGSDTIEGAASTSITMQYGRAVLRWLPGRFELS